MSGNLDQIMRQLVDHMKDENDAAPKRDPDIEAELLRDALGSLNRRHEFTPGMIVRQKRDVALYRSTGNGLHIVVEVLPEPIFDKNAGLSTAAFGLPHDLIIAHIDGDGDFIIHHVDSRRFEPVSEEDLRRGGRRE